MNNPLKRFGIETSEKNLWEGAIYGLACAYLLVEREIAAYLREYDLTPAKFNALMIIKHKGGQNGISQVQIGNDLIVTESNMTRLLDRLEAESLVERLPQKGDRRVKLIRVSVKGSSLLDAVWPGYYNKIRTLANIMDEPEAKNLSLLLGKWCAKLGAI